MLCLSPDKKTPISYLERNDMYRNNEILFVLPWICLGNIIFATHSGDMSTLTTYRFEKVGAGGMAKRGCSSETPEESNAVDEYAGLVQASLAVLY
jgi:hypothetical protein